MQQVEQEEQVLLYLFTCQSTYHLPIYSSDFLFLLALLTDGWAQQKCLQFPMLVHALFATLTPPSNPVLHALSPVSPSYLCLPAIPCCLIEPIHPHHKFIILITFPHTTANYVLHTYFNKALNILNDSTLTHLSLPLLRTP